MKGKQSMFDLSKLGVGEWFPYQDSTINPETGEITWLPVDPNSKDRICFKSPDPDETRVRQEKFRGKKINNHVLNTLSKAMEIVPTYEQTPEQEKAERTAFWDEAIPAWEIFDPKGVQIPCTAENKYKLIKGHMPFLRFANRCVQTLQGVKVEAEKKQEKN
jgi:hypothetical protein